MKKILLLIIPFSFVCGASLVKLTQIIGSPREAILGTDAAGKLQQLTLGTGLSISNGILNVQPGIPIPPLVINTRITTSTPNSFPIPPTKTSCLVNRNIPQVINEDYTITNNNIVFNTPPEVGDIVQQICF